MRAIRLRRRNTEAEGYVVRLGGEKTCRYCRHLDYINRLRGGRQYLCHHPDADPLGPKRPAPVWPEQTTPDWCPVGEMSKAEDGAD